MFTEEIVHAGGTSRGTASEAHVRYLLRRAVRRGYDIEATPAGGVRIDWKASTFSGGGTPVREDRAIVIAPQTPVGTLTPRVREDLALIAATPAARYATQDDRRVIDGGLWRIAPYPTALLRARGLLTEEDGGTVRLSLAAQLGLLAAAHRTSTTRPEGFHRPADPYGSSGLNRPGGRAGMTYDGTSAAVCTCGELSAHGGSRAEARALAAAHRRAMATAFVTAQLGVPTP